MRTLVIAVAVLLSVTVAPTRAQFCTGAAPYVFTDNHNWPLPAGPEIRRGA